MNVRNFTRCFSYFTKPILALNNKHKSPANLSLTITPAPSVHLLNRDQTQDCPEDEPIIDCNSNASSSIQILYDNDHLLSTIPK